MTALILFGPNAADVRVLLALAVGIGAGIVLLLRGFGGYRAAGRIGGIGASRIASIAMGEVLVVGVAEPIELTLVSPLQSAPCVYYRARVAGSGDGENGDVFHEERAVGFRIRDDSGAVRVFPARARFDVPDRYDEQAGAWGSSPAGLLPRTGSAFGPGVDRESQVAALLAVHDPRRDPWFHSLPLTTVLGGGTTLSAGNRELHYSEARIDAGDIVTVVGRALPFGDLADPAAANLLDGSAVAADDPEVAADLAAARAAGALEGSPQEAW